MKLLCKPVTLGEYNDYICDLATGSRVGVFILGENRVADVTRAMVPMSFFDGDITNDRLLKYTGNATEYRNVSAYNPEMCEYRASLGCKYPGHIHQSWIKQGDKYIKVKIDDTICMLFDQLTTFNILLKRAGNDIWNAYKAYHLIDTAEFYFSNYPEILE